MNDTTPQRMRELADAVDWPGVPGEPNTATPEALSNAAVALRAAADQLEAVRHAQTTVIDDPVAGRIVQRVRWSVVPPAASSDEQVERFVQIAKRFPPSAALVKAWDAGWQAGWSNRHKAIPDADGRVGLSDPIDNPYAADTVPQEDRDD